MKDGLETDVDLGEDGAKNGPLVSTNRKEFSWEKKLRNIRPVRG